MKEFCLYGCNKRGGGGVEPYGETLKVTGQWEQYYNTNSGGAGSSADGLR